MDSNGNTSRIVISIFESTEALSVRERCKYKTYCQHCNPERKCEQ